MRGEVDEVGFVLSLREKKGEGKMVDEEGLDRRHGLEDECVGCVLRYQIAMNIEFCVLNYMLSKRPRHFQLCVQIGCQYGQVSTGNGQRRQCRGHEVHNGSSDK